MKNEDIYDAVTEIPDTFVEEAITVKLEKSRVMRTRILAAAATVIFAVGMGGFFLINRGNQNDPGSTNGAISKAGNSKSPTDTVWERTEENQVYAASDYEEVFLVLQEIADRNMYDDRNTGEPTMDMAVEDAVPAEVATEAAEMDMGESSASGAQKESGADYSGTNTQVKEVDEADVVKTDGQYIYLLRDNEVVILRADGKESSVVSRFDVAKGDSKDASEHAFELYLSGDRLIVIKNVYEWSGGPVPYFREEKSDDNRKKIAPDSIYRSQEYVSAVIYDIRDRSNPKRIGDAGQEGYYVSSRLMNDVLYLISNYSVWDLSRPDFPESYIPCVLENGVFRAIAPESICVGMNPDSQYSVASTISIHTAEIISSESVLGGAAEIYMNKENLYVARSIYNSEVVETYEEKPYTVQKYEDTRFTELVRFSLNDGYIRKEASGRVDGTLLNQFSMDEKEGYLRIVTTTEYNSYTTYTDKEHDWTNYEGGENYSTNALFILSPDLKVAGAIEDLAPDERVYSVRFDGEVGYFVTFRQVDPLFTVDLQDPADPKVMSELKIPGFSQYMHVFSEGRLFGLGMDADEETGRTGSMKLSMFDTSDPYDVTQMHTLMLNDSYSVALYNHKAILISAERDLIAFPSENGYGVYGYSDEKGFYPKAQMDIDANWHGDVRGLYIEDFFYVATAEDVYVFLLDDFSNVAKVSVG